MADISARTTSGGPSPVHLEPTGSRRRGSGMKSPAREDVVGQLRALLFSELGAATTYGEASRSVRSAEVARRLSAIAKQHAAHAEELERHIRRLCGTAEGPSAGPSAPWAKLSEITEAFLTGPAGWNNIRERERLGLKRFRDALDRVDPASREALLGTLIPGQFRNMRDSGEGISDS